MPLYFVTQTHLPKSSSVARGVCMRLPHAESHRQRRHADKRACGMVQHGPHATWPLCMCAAEKGVYQACARRHARNGHSHLLSVTVCMGPLTVRGAVSARCSRPRVAHAHRASRSSPNPYLCHRKRAHAAAASDLARSVSTPPALPPRPSLPHTHTETHKSRRRASCSSARPPLSRPHVLVRARRECTL